MGDTLFSQIVLSLFPHCRFVSQPQFSLNYTVDLVVGDIASFSNHATYWNARQVPYLLSVGEGLASTLVPTPPETWSTYSHPFSPSDMGGSTCGIHQLMVFIPPPHSTLPASSLALPVQPWIPLHAALNPVTSAQPTPEWVAPLERVP